MGALPLVYPAAAGRWGGLHHQCHRNAWVFLWTVSNNFLGGSVRVAALVVVDTRELVQGRGGCVICSC
jgi:hypothetical protein